MEFSKIAAAARQLCARLAGGLTVTRRITLWYLILSITPILAIGFLAYQSSRTTLEAEIVNKLNAVADNKSYIIERWFRDQLRDSQTLANSLAVRDLLSPSFRVVYPNLTAKSDEERIRKVRELVAALQETNASYVDILIADADGRILISSSRALRQEGKSLKAAGLAELAAKKDVVSSVFYSQAAQQPVFTMTGAVFDNNANIVGYAILEIELRPIHRLLEERSGLGETGEVIIVDRNLRLLTQSRFSDESTLLKTIPGNLAIQQGLQGNKGVLFFQDYRRVPVLGAYRPLPIMEAVLIAKTDEAEAFRPIARLRDTTLAIIVLTIGLAAWVAMWVARVTTRPILEAERLEKLRADFTAMIIHDLRTPLTALLSALAILEDGLAGPLSQQQKEWLAKIASGTRQLLHLVNEFLDLSKLEQGRVELIKENVNLKQLVDTVLEHYAILAQQKRITLTNRVEPGLGSICADPRRLGQVFSNLVGNAIKFTGEGGTIEIGASRLNGGAKVWVKDTGVGIPAAEMDQLFQKYRQTTSGKSAQQKGTGLDCSVVRCDANA